MRGARIQDHNPANFIVGKQQFCRVSNNVIMFFCLAAVIFYFFYLFYLFMTKVPKRETEPFDSCLSTVREGRYLCRDYSVEDILGKGGFGTVYSGRRKTDNTPVSF